MGQQGLIAPGNIDVHRRPRVTNADGSISTVRSIGINVDGKEVLIPTVSDDGLVLSNSDAVALFRRTGKHLGVFDTPQNATAFAQQLHQQQAQEYMPQVDYDALAAKARTPSAAVDYDSLASKARGGEQPPPRASQAAAPAPHVSAAGRGTGLDVRRSDDFASGIRAGAASTVYHGGDMIRRATGMERVIDRPEVQAAITPPQNFAGKTGFYGEHAAEFLAPLSRVAKLSEALPWFGRTMAEAGTGAGVAGVQTGGDPASMVTSAGLSVVAPLVVKGVVGATRGTVNTVRAAAAGAADGGVTGAVAGAIRQAAPAEARNMLTMALKPRATNVNWARSVDSALPDLKFAETTLGRSVSSIDDLLEATKLAKRNVRAQYDEMAGPLRENGSTVDLTPVAEEVTRRIPRKVQLMDPKRAEKIAEGADAYRRRFSLEDAEALLKDTNAELDAFYAQYPGAQRSSLAARPEVAQLVAEADALRKTIYETLDAEGQGEAARAVQRRYGALMDVEQEAYRRMNVAKRQQPESLSEQIGKVRAAGEYAKGAWRLAHGDLAGAADIASARAQRGLATYLKEQQTTDMLIKRAFAGYRGQPMPAHAPVAATAQASTARSAAR